MRRWLCRHFHTRHHELHIGNVYNDHVQITLLICDKCGIIQMIAAPFGKDVPEMLTKDRKGII